MKHRDDIDGLRAVAVVPVLLFHFGTGLFGGGFTGVDVFFVISGFVIAGSILADIRAGTFSVANFYFKRVRRIFPALAAVLIATSIAAVAILLPSDLLGYGKSLMATAAFGSNLYFWKASGYFAPAAQTQPLLHTWSLSVEEQFYIFAPIAFALIYRHGRQRWLLFVAPLIVASFAAAVLAVFAAPTAGFFLLPTRMWELLLGALIALRGRPAHPRRRVREAQGAAGLLLILFGMATLRETDPFPGWNALYPCLGTALLIQAGLGIDAAERPLANRLLATRPFVLVGLISYSLYLVHWPVAAFTRYLSLRDPGWPAIVAMLVASVALAWANWRYVEQPFRRAPVTRKPRVLAAGAAMVAAGVALGGAVVAAHGLPARYPDLVERRIPGVEDWGGDRCFNQNPQKEPDWSAAACTRIHGSRGRILLWGDSFAAQYMPGILRDRARIDADVLQYTFAGCPPILAYFSYARLGCARFNAHALAIVRAEKIDTVVLSGRWTDAPARTIDRLHETVAALRSLGVRVVVFGQSPEFATDVQHIDYISGSRMRPGVASWPIFFDPAFNRRLAAQATGARFVDPLRALCVGRLCPYRVDATFLHADYGHFSTAGALDAVRRYFPSGRRETGATTVTPVPPSPDGQGQKKQ